MPKIIRDGDDRNEAKVDIEQDRLQTMSTFHDVLVSHQTRGFGEHPPPDVPRPVDVLPADITADAVAIASTFIEHQAWANFASAELARTNAQLVEVSNKLSIRQHTVLSAYRRTTSQWSSDEAKAELWSDGQYADLVAVQQRLTQEKLLFEADLGRLKGNLAILSRLVTVRGQEVQLAGRPPRLRGRK